jgi:hypothetical protein
LASSVDICNLALNHFGQDANISSIDPSDGSAEGDLAARFYPIARDELLEEFDWTFARKRTTLAQVTNDRDDVGYKYALPSDLLKARRLLPSGYTDEQNDAADYEMEGSYLYTDDAQPTLVYTKTLTDTTKFSAMFVVSLSYRVASYISGPIVKDPTGQLQRGLRTASDAEAARAKQVDANSERKRATHTSTAQRTR